MKFRAEASEESTLKIAEEDQDFREGTGHEGSSLDLGQVSLKPKRS